MVSVGSIRKSIFNDVIFNDVYHKIKEIIKHNIELGEIYCLYKIEKHTFDFTKRYSEYLMKTHLKGFIIKPENRLIKFSSPLERKTKQK